MSWLNRRGAVAVALAWGLCGGAGAAAADDLTDGVKLYEGLDYEKAQKSLEAAVKDESLSSSDIGRAAMYLGLVHYNLGDTVAAETYFGVALTFDDSLQLPSGTSPKIATTFDSIRKLVFPVPRIVESDGVKEVNINKEGLGGPDKGIEGGTTEPDPDTGLPWFTIGSGGATVISGGIAIYFALKARATKNTIQDSPHPRDELEALRDDLNSQNTTANVMLAVTGAFALSTAAFYLFEIHGAKSGSKERSATVGASVTGSSAWVGAAWTF